jgi:hypothetical protein
MLRWSFHIVIDFDAQALMRVLQPFAVRGLRPSWLLLSEQAEAFLLTAHYDDLDDQTAAQLLVRLQQMPWVRDAAINLLAAPKSALLPGGSPH